jgi:DNA-directed RNA polymerase specialized sigma subunit
VSEGHNTGGFPHIDLSILSKREQLILHMRYCAGWSLHEVASGVRTAYSLVQREHSHAVQVIRESGGALDLDDDD